ncbi:hypothetical protein [Paenibacillus sp. NRS-1760]|uniref:hypothetical protein n=1 Tax=Paenibacillus sp. NRS-1760 TaxID=3233902 RepID=UPI003D2D1166
MGKTVLTIEGEQFVINGKKTYTEIEGSPSHVHGLLMNARFVQGVFDDKQDPNRFHRFGRRFDPDQNTNDLIAALPEWYRAGLRAFTVCFQGGGPCFTIENPTIDNNPFSVDGTSIDPAYADRMDRLIRAADELGMVVIVSYFYTGQTGRLNDGKVVLNAVRAASRFLKEGAYTNVIIEVCNEHNIARDHPLIASSEGMVALMEIARSESGGMPVGCSGLGRYINEEVCKESDVILIHGNLLTRQHYYNHIQQVKAWAPGKPVVCNEDSPDVSKLDVALRTRTSWGYYNNSTKQEVPADWTITPGEDQFFAQRMAEGLGIDWPAIPEDEQFYLQGFEPDMSYEGKRWIRLASLYPEKINYVDFYRNGELHFTCYDGVHAVNHKKNWEMGAVEISSDDEEWKAVVHLHDGRMIEKIGKV